MGGGPSQLNRTGVGIRGSTGPDDDDEACPGPLRGGDDDLELIGGMSDRTRPIKATCGKVSACASEGRGQSQYDELVVVVGVIIGEEDVDAVDCENDDDNVGGVHTMGCCWTLIKRALKGPSSLVGGGCVVVLMCTAEG
jgi:hypothetical protein